VFLCAVYRGCKCVPLALRPYVVFISALASKCQYTVTFMPLLLLRTLFAVHYEITEQAAHQKSPSHEPYIIN